MALNGALRDFVVRRLRRAPIIEPLWDEHERVLADRDRAAAERDLAIAAERAARQQQAAAIADRDAALAACGAAVSERDRVIDELHLAHGERATALAARDMATAELERATAEHSAAVAAITAQTEPCTAADRPKLNDCNVPTQFAVTPALPCRILLIGSCFAEGLAHYAPRVIPGCEVDHILYNHVAALPPQPPRPISEYDFQVIALPLRSVMPETVYMRLNYADVAAYESAFAESVLRLHQLLDSALAYSRQFGKLTFVANFLVPQQNPLGRLLPKFDIRNPAYLCEKLNEELERIVRAVDNAYVVDFDMIAAGLGKRWIQDDLIWSYSHGTYLNDWDEVYDGNRLEPLPPITQQTRCSSSEFVKAVWEEMLAMFRTARQVDPIKMVVVDLDDTLWRGVAADEDSIDTYMIEGWPLGFIESLQYLKKRGILLAVITKNQRELIEKLWPRLCGGRIELDDLAATKVNWRPKAENMEELLAEVNLLPRNVLFIDDNPVERAAMQQAYPQMRVVGANPYEHRRLLLSAPETQVATITDEAGRRTEMVQRQIDREHARQRMSRPEFLASLGIRFRLIELTDADHPQFRRAFELLNKTNQFNTTGKRWTSEDIREALATGMTIYGFEVEDKYTRYGLVGVVLVRKNVFEQFVMSCRVVGLDVEIAAVSLIARLAAATADGPLRAVARYTDANLLSRDLWQRCGFERKEDDWQTHLTGIAGVPPHITTADEQALAAVA